MTRPHRFVIGKPARLRQSVMEIAYGSEAGACRPKVRSGFGTTTCKK
jgi:hypothetical protein